MTLIITEDDAKEYLRVTKVLAQIHQYKDLVLDILHNNKLLNIKNHKIIRKEYKESHLTYSEYGELYDNTTMPKLSYSFKIDKKELGIDSDFMLNMYLNTL